MENALDGLKSWFTGFDDSKPFWTLYMGNGKDIIQSNFTNNDLDESYQILENLIIDQHSNGITKFVVLHKTSKTDAKPAKWILNFPRNGRKYVGVGSVGASQQDFWIQKAIDEQQKSSNLQLENYKETVELKHQIAMMSAQEKSWVSDLKNLISELMNNDLAKAVGAKIASNFLAPAEQAAVIASLEQTEEAVVPNEKNNDLGINEINKLVSLTDELRNQGFENPVEILEKLVKFTKKNPDMVKGFVKNL